MDLMIFGAAGDLSARKLFPALYHLHYCDLLPEGCGFMRYRAMRCRWKVFSIAFRTGPRHVK